MLRPSPSCDEFVVPKFGSKTRISSFVYAEPRGTCLIVKADLRRCSCHWSRVRDHYSQYVLAISVFAQFKKFINVAGLANRIIKKQCCIFSSNNVIYVKKQSTSEAKENKSTRKIDEISTRIQAEFTGICHNCDNNFNLTIWQNERSW